MIQIGNSSSIMVRIKQRARIKKNTYMYHVILRIYNNLFRYESSTFTNHFCSSEYEYRI